MRNTIVDNKYCTLLWNYIGNIFSVFLYFHDNFILMPYIDKHNCIFKERTLLQVSHKMEYTLEGRGRRNFITEGLYSIIIEVPFLMFLRM